MSGLAATNPAIGSSGASGAGGRAGGRAASRAEGRAGGRVPPSVYVLGGLATAGFVALFYRWLVKQAQISTSQLEDWGHALVIPLIAGWILWQKRAMMAREPIRAFWPGLMPMLLGIVCYMFFVVGVPNHMLQGFSIILTLFGAVLLVLGPAIMRHAFLPIAYLGFAVTLAERIMIEITFQLKLIASWGAWVLLSATGQASGAYTVRLEGNMLHMLRMDGTDFPMNVADACSGMRMVVAFVALGGAVALLGTQRWWQRVAIMLLTVPVAVLMNVLRVAVLGWLGYFNEDLAGGEAHMVIGTALLLPSLLFFMFLVWALGKIVHEEGEEGAGVKNIKGAKNAKGSGKQGAKGAAKKGSKKVAKKKSVVLPPAAPGSGLGGLVRAVRGPAMVVALVVFGATAAGMGAAVSYFRLYLTKLPIYAPDNRALVSIPTETENWRRVGDDRVESPEVQKTLGTENYVTRNYVLRSTEGTSTPLVLALHAAYYTGTIDTVPHVPERCFVGGGMEMGDSSVTLPLDLDDSNWLRDSRVDADPSVANLHGRVFTTRLSNQYGDSGGTRVRLPLDPHDIEMRITRFLAPGEGNVYAGYFFVANGGTTASAEGVRLLAFRLEDDYAYYLKVQVTSASVGSEAELRDAASGLLSELLGEIMRCAPDWVDVERGEYPADNPRRAAAGEGGGAG